MKIYADTSFLVSLLYPGDIHHLAARNFFAQHQADEWITSAWSLFETGNSLRQLCLNNKTLLPATIESIRRQFKHWHTQGAFATENVEMDEAVLECQQLSAALGIQMKMRSADVLHVALLEQITPDLFVTRDKEQYALAVNRAFTSELLP